MIWPHLSEIGVPDVPGCQLYGGNSPSRGVSGDLFKVVERVPGSDRALGWQVAAPDNSAGPDLSSSAFGHTGFTGTSLWIDPVREMVIVLLTNRVHPTRDNTRIIAFRPIIHSAIARAVVDQVGAE